MGWPRFDPTERRLGDPPAFVGLGARSFRDHPVVPGGGPLLDVCLRWTAGWAVGGGLAVQAWVGPRLFWATEAGRVGIPLLEGLFLGVVIGALTTPVLGFVYGVLVRRSDAVHVGASPATRLRARPRFRHLGRWTARVVFVLLLTALIVRDGMPGS